MDAEDAEGRTLLWHAALHDDVQSAKVLLEPLRALDFGTDYVHRFRRCSSRRSIDGPRGHVLVLRHGAGRPRIANALAPRGCSDARVAAAAARLLLPTRAMQALGNTQFTGILRLLMR